MQYLTTLRMHSAQELLRDTDKSINTIAHKLGYESAFSRSFKKENKHRGSWHRRYLFKLEQEAQKQSAQTQHRLGSYLGAKNVD